MKSFWNDLEKPFFVLAPMADVTDMAFRTIFSKYGPPDVYWTEFVSADGLCSIGKEKLEKDLLFDNNQRPIVAQLFTSVPENMYKAGMLVKSLGFDGLDINMGCPDKSIEKQGSGAGMIKDPERALAVIKAAKETGLPVSVKTRVGYNLEEIDTWIPILLNSGIEALSIHLRTRKEMSLVPANWEYMNRIVSFRDKLAPGTLIIGNGDVETLKYGEEVIKKTGCDGVMIGRGMFGNPWIFNKEELKETKSLNEILRALIEHTHLFEKHVNHKSFHVMKKHYKAYVQGFDGAKDLRIKLMEEAENSKDVERIIDKFLINKNL